MHGNAWVYGNAQVCGNAWVCGNAQVFSNALISKSADILWFSSVGTENGTLTAYTTKDCGIELTRGCFRGSIEEFIKASKGKHDEFHQSQYMLLINYIINHFKQYK